jgi:hypothetical protein
LQPEGRCQPKIGKIHEVLPPASELQTSTDKGKDRYYYAGSHTAQKSRITDILGCGIKKIAMQKMSECQSCEQYSGSAQDVQNSHVIFPSILCDLNFLKM